jgi:hypothetical protein
VRAPFSFVLFFCGGRIVEQHGAKTWSVAALRHWRPGLLHSCRPALTGPAGAFGAPLDPCQLPFSLNDRGRRAHWPAGAGSGRDHPGKFANISALLQSGIVQQQDGLSVVEQPLLLCVHGTSTFVPSRWCFGGGGCLLTSGRQWHRWNRRHSIGRGASHASSSAVERSFSQSS